MLEITCSSPVVINNVDAILGTDGCIYWPPCFSQVTHIVKFDPVLNDDSLEVGDDLGSVDLKWASGALAPDGNIYCIPESANQVLCIDPFKHFKANLKDNMEQHPEKLGFLFEMNSASETLHESAIRKFGVERASNAIEKVFEDCIDGNGLFERTNIYPFMIAASLDNSVFSVVYYLLRRDPSIVGTLFGEE